jgi:uncharacterized protein HemX
MMGTPEYRAGYEAAKNTYERKNLTKILIGVFVLVALIVAGMAFMPGHNVWASEMRGRSELARAEHNKQILALEAQAMLEAERFNAQAEIVRAEGMRQAMEIEGGALTMEYIYYLWVRTMAGNENIVYIPTEASLPILEMRR